VSSLDEDLEAIKRMEAQEKL